MPIALHDIIIVFEISNKNACLTALCQDFGWSEIVLMQKSVSLWVWGIIHNATFWQIEVIIVWTIEIIHNELALLLRCMCLHVWIWHSLWTLLRIVWQLQRSRYLSLALAQFSWNTLIHNDVLRLNIHVCVAWWLSCGSIVYIDRNWLSLIVVIIYLILWLQSRIIACIWSLWSRLRLRCLILSLIISWLVTTLFRGPIV